MIVGLQILILIAVGLQIRLNEDSKSEFPFIPSSVAVQGAQHLSFPSFSSLDFMSVATSFSKEFRSKRRGHFVPYSPLKNAKRNRQIYSPLQLTEIWSATFFKKSTVFFKKSTPFYKKSTPFLKKVLLGIPRVQLPYHC